MTDASGVWGEGFDIMKVSRDKKAKAKKAARILVCATNNATKIDTARTALEDKYDVRSLLQIGCDTRKEFYSVILGQEPHKRLSFVKRFFGFDTFYMDKDGKVTLVEGDYTFAEYQFSEYASLEDMKKYLDSRGKKSN